MHDPERHATNTRSPNTPCNGYMRPSAMQPTHAPRTPCRKPHALPNIKCVNKLAARASRCVTPLRHAIFPNYCQLQFRRVLPTRLESRVSPRAPPGCSAGRPSCIRFRIPLRASVLAVSQRSVCAWPYHKYDAPLADLSQRVAQTVGYPFYARAAEANISTSVVSFIVI